MTATIAKSGSDFERMRSHELWIRRRNIKSLPVLAQSVQVSSVSKRAKQIRPLARLAIALVIVLAITATNAQDKKTAEVLTEVVVADSYRVAFYSNAPRSIENSMRKAVQGFCIAYAAGNTSAEHSPNNNTEFEWLCKKTKLRFFRGVDVAGYKRNEGFVCNDDSWGNLKYLSEGMVEDGLSDCVSVWYDDDRKLHYLDSSLGKG